MTVKITEQAFDPWLEIQNYQKTLNDEGKFGACATFVSTMRDASDHGASAKSDTAADSTDTDEQSLQRVAYQTALKWNILGSLVIQRSSAAIKAGEPILLVAVWAAHRNAAFDACHYLLDHLPGIKTGTAPTGQYA